MIRVLRADGLAQLMAILGVLLLVGWGGGWFTLAAAGAVGVAVVGLLRTWGRRCLTGVHYQRELPQHRALFGETLSMRVSVVNDKLLPVTWLAVEDELKGRVTVEGSRLVERGSHCSLAQVLSVGPYSRVERRVGIVCDRRGLHRFGPVHLESGDPIGLRSRVGRIELHDELLVYPKIFELAPTGIVPQVLLGDARAARLIVEDPVRMVGHREYRPGDPIRSIDWRASARSRTELVRICEPSAGLRVAIFLDTAVPQLQWPNMNPPELEFLIAVGASLAVALLGQGVGVGLFSTATVEGRPVAYPASATPQAQVDILELLARASPFGAAGFADVLRLGGDALGAGTSVVVVAADFPTPTLLALERVRARHPVTALSVITDQGSPPPAGLVDRCLETPYVDNWPTRTILHVAA